MIGEEADLDFEVAIPLIYPQKTVLFQTDDEWYQKDMSRPGSSYTGFFNSNAPSLPWSIVQKPLNPLPVPYATVLKPADRS